MSHLTQIDEAQRNESLRQIAVLRFEPDFFAAHYGLEFQTDARDTSVGALVVTESGHQFMLLRHHDSPVPGTEILASEWSSEPRHDLEEILAELGLGEDAVIWRLDPDDTALPPGA